MNADPPLRCLIVDDSASFLETARSTLQRERMAVVGVATTIPQALRLVKDLVPDVTLVDIDLGAESGFDLARQVHALDTTPSTVVLMSNHAKADFLDLIAASPAAGFLSKSDLSAGAIQEVMRTAASRRDVDAGAGNRR